MQHMNHVRFYKRQMTKSSLFICEFPDRDIGIEVFSDNTYVIQEYFDNRLEFNAEIITENDFINIIRLIKCGTLKSNSIKRGNAVQYF